MLFLYNCEIYGNNHTINFTSNNCIAPLIGTIGTDGRIEDLSITGTVDITSTSYTGPDEIAMISYVNKGLIKNVHANDATILANTLSEGRAAVFSVEGQGGTFFGCTTNNVTVKGYDYVGCIVAYGNGVNVQWCDIYNTNVYGHSYVGLLAGCTTGTYMYCNVGSGAKDTCHVSGYEYVGGAFGYIEFGSVYTDQCHVHNVDIIAYDYVGGYIGVSESRFNTALNGIRSYICDVNIYARSSTAEYVGGVIGEYQTDLYEDEDEGEIEDKSSGFCIYMRDVVINSEGECRPVCGNTENEDLVDVYRAYNIKYNEQYYIKTS